MLRHRQLNRYIMYLRSHTSDLKYLFVFLFCFSSLITKGQELEYSIDELMGKADIDLYGEDINLRKEAHDAFVKMRDAAAKEGIKMQVVSSYRSFYRQASIFEAKYERYTDVDGMEPLPAIDKIIEYSTIPGTSRHHWGTDVDIIDGSVPAEGDGHAAA